MEQQFFASALAGEAGDVTSDVYGGGLPDMSSMGGVADASAEVVVEGAAIEQEPAVDDKDVAEETPSADNVEQTDSSVAPVADVPESAEAPADQAAKNPTDEDSGTRANS